MERSFGEGLAIRELALSQRLLELGQTFSDPNGSSKTALIAEIPDIEAFQELMKSDAAAEAMKHDGVKPETLLLLSEGQ